MKYIKALLICTCLSLSIVGCGTSKGNKNLDSLAEETTSEEIQTSEHEDEAQPSEEPSEESSEESSDSEAEHRLNDEEYGELMCDLSQFSTATEHDRSKSSILLEYEDYSVTIDFQNVDNEQLDSFMSRGEEGDREESGDAYKLTYSTDGDFRKILDYGTNKKEWYFEVLDNSFSPTCSIVTWDGNLHDMSVYTSSVEICEKPDSLKFDGLDLTSTLQDVMDTYGLPTDAHVSKGLGSFDYTVVYKWEILDNIEGYIRAEFAIVDAEDGGHNLMLESIGLEDY